MHTGIFISLHYLRLSIYLLTSRKLLKCLLSCSQATSLKRCTAGLAPDFGTVTLGCSLKVIDRGTTVFLGCDFLPVLDSIQ